MSINIFLRENLSKIAKNSLYIAPDIPEKKVNGAVKAFNYSGDVSNIIALFDDTLFGSGKTGILFTGKQMIYKEDFEDPVVFDYEEIQNFAEVELITDPKKDKKEKRLSISKKGGSVSNIRLICSSDIHYDIFASVMNEAISQFDEFKEERQLVPIEMMDEALKTAYVQVLVNMAFDNDRVIDDKELAEILLLMSRIEISAQSRMTIRSYMADYDNRLPLSELLDTIKNTEPGGQLKTIHISLVKDLINAYVIVNEIRGDISLEGIKGFEFLNKNRQSLLVSDDEIDLIIKAIDSDRKILNDDLTDDQITSMLKDVSAKAAAIGAPIAAIYLSGSVIGMSAAGITSGLSALGLGGVFGLSGMVTGIGVAVLIGVSAYSGVRKLTGADELGKSKKREMMLNMVIKLTQKTVSQLIEDINAITLELNHVIDNQDLLKQKIGYLKQLVSSGNVLNEKSENAQSKATKLRCALYLDETKLKQLTQDATKSEYFDFIRSFYEEVEVVNLDNKEKSTEMRLKVKKGIPNIELEKLANAFEVIGYFDVASVVSGKIKGLFGG